MGTWSHEPFGNDDANDWADGLEGARDLSYVESALDAVLGVDGYLEALEAWRAVAAVEVIAKLLGKGTQSDSDTEAVDEWVASVQIEPTRALLEKARRALARVRSEQSELKELWDDGDATEWEASLDRLSAAVTA